MPSRRRPLLLDAAIANTLFYGLFLAGGFLLIRDGLSIPLVTFAAFTDYWEHTAALTEWMRNLAAPANPHVVSDDLSSRYMPIFYVLSLLGQNLSLTAVQLMSISAVINYCLIALGLHLFLRYYFRDVWAPLIGFILAEKTIFLTMIVQRTFAGINQFPLLAIPFFILAGELMNATGIIV